MEEINHSESQFQSQNDQREINIILLLNSEFQPIHNGHIKMMELAKKFLIEKNGSNKTNVKGILAPSNKQQLFFQHLDDDVRLRMITLTIKNIPWLVLDDSLVEKKVKTVKELTNRIQVQNKSLQNLQIYELMSLDKYPLIQQNMNNYQTQNIIFIEYRFTFEDDQVLDIQKQIQEQPRFQLIRDTSSDLDIHSRVIRDIYNAGFDISLYVSPDIIKFHKSQNIKYKNNPNLKNKDSTSKKSSSNTNKKDGKESKKENKKSTKNSKEDLVEVKKEQKVIQQQQKKPAINIKSFIDFEFKSISAKELSGFNLPEIANPQKVKEEEEEVEQEDDEEKEEQKQQVQEKDKNFLGSGLQARVISMKYKTMELDIQKELEVAVKMVKFSNQVSRRQATFYRDLRGLWRCRGHPNVVQVYGAGNTKDIGYIVLERCTRTRFKHIILKYTAEQLYSNKHFMQLLTDLSDGCDFMAKQGILHRDFQINNILIKLNCEDQDKETFELEEIKQLKVSDFGVSAIDEDKENIVKGSTRHYAPESIEDKANYTPKSDVFSFGALLYEIFYKRWVFPDCTVQESCQKTKSGELTPLDATIPLQLQQIILNTWKFNPEERITFTQLTQQLQEFTNSLKSEITSQQSQQ